MKSPRPAFCLDVNSLEAVDSVCIRFEDSLRKGQDPCILDALSGEDAEQVPALLSEMLSLESDYLPRETCAARIVQYRQALPHLNWVFNGAVASQTLTIDAVMPNNGDQIGPYRVVERSGYGAFGAVHLAVDSRDGEQVALKIATVNSDQQVDSIRREISFLGRLTHPSIIELLDIVQDENGTAIVMPFVTGGTLRQHFETTRKDLEHFVGRLISLVDGIEYAHTQGIVHRDIEPGNILINTDGEFILSDFGLAIHESDQPDADGESAGSMAYMSPEQVRGESHWLDGRADIWAIGVILYEGLTGKRPFPANDRATLTDEILYKPIKPPRQINPGICPALENICLHCLARAASKRYATARDLSDDLKTWHRGRRAGQTRCSMLCYASVAAALTATVAFLIAWLSFNAGTNQSEEQSSTLSGIIEDQAQSTQIMLTKERGQLWAIRDSYERFAFRIGRDSQFYDIDSQNALPLHTDDELWVLGEPPEDWSVFAFLVDSSGSVHYLSPPEGAIAWRRIPSVAKGSEAIVLISSTHPIDVQETRLRFPQLADQSQTVSRDALRYINGSPTSRSTQNSTTGELPAMYSNQLRIAEAFSDSGCHVHAIVYGVASKE